MKLLPIVLCCLFLMFDLQLINGQNLAKNVLEKIHETGDKVKLGLGKMKEKVKTGLDNILGKVPKKEENTGTGVGSNKDQVTTSATSTERTSTTVSNSGNMVFPTEEPVKFVSEPEKPSVSTTAPTTIKNNATDHEGKENFVGGCLPGYQRTADGRCMPVY